jgi:hypothetical protein
MRRLVISSISTQTSDMFGVSKTSTTIAPNSSDTLIITFSPSAVGNYADTLTITSNAAPPVVRIPLAGIGDNPLSVEWSSFHRHSKRARRETPLGNLLRSEQRRDLKWSANSLRPIGRVIGFVQGRGTTSEVQRYAFNDNAAPSGSVLYRLKQVDFDGTIFIQPYR